MPDEEGLLKGSLENAEDLDIEDHEGPKGIEIPIGLLAFQQEARSFEALEVPVSSARKIPI